MDHDIGSAEGMPATRTSFSATDVDRAQLRQLHDLAGDAPYRKQNAEYRV